MRDPVFAHSGSIDFLGAMNVGIGQEYTDTSSSKKLIEQRQAEGCKDSELRERRLLLRHRPLSKLGVTKPGPPATCRSTLLPLTKSPSGEPNNYKGTSLSSFLFNSFSFLPSSRAISSPEASQNLSFVFH